MTEKDKAFWYQKFTLEGRIFYPDLLEPKAGTNGKLKFSCMFAFKIGTNPAELAKVASFLQQAKGDYFPSIPMQFFVNPLKRFDTYQRMDGKPNHEFLRDHYWLNLSSGVDFPPPVVNKMRQPIMDKVEVYSGRNAVINLTFYKIDNDKKGVGTNVNAVMLLDGGEKEGGASVGVNINEVFGSFAQDMSIQSQPMGNGYPPAPPVTPPNFASEQRGIGQNAQIPAYPSNSPHAPQQPYNPNANPGWNPNGQGNNGGGFI